MYSNDSFFTLNPLQATGLIGVSVFLAVIALFVVGYISRRVSIWVCPVVAVTVFAGFVWVSPQLYYVYYQQIFSGLPQQWVIGKPPTISDLLELLTFSKGATLSAHSVGVLGWGLIVMAFWSCKRRKVNDGSSLL